MAASAYHVISKEVKNRIFRRNRIFRHICINNPHRLFIRKRCFFCPSLDFLDIMLEIRLRFFKYFS